MKLLKKPKEFLSWLWTRFQHWWLLILTIGGIVVAGYLGWRYWYADILPWVQGSGGANGGSQGEILRNMALALGGAAAFVVGLPLAIWRSIVAHEQAATAVRNLNNERYQRGAEMLGSEKLTTRVGGVFALENLAKEYPDEYHIQIMKLLCSFIRNSKGQDNSDEARCPEDIHLATQVIRTRSIEQIKIEGKTNGYELDLSYANLLNTRLNDANLSNATLFAANLTDLKLMNSNLSNAILARAILRRANLGGVNFSGANLSTADFTDAKNLTQAQLDKTVIWEGTDPPKLDGLSDSETEEPLIWRGKVVRLSDNVRFLDDDEKDK